jgi:hypothetical protein
MAQSQLQPVNNFIPGESLTAAAFREKLNEMASICAEFAAMADDLRRVIAQPQQHVVFPRHYFPVRVVKDGGVNGDENGPATYTYTVKDLNDNVLGTGVELNRLRENGPIVLQEDHPDNNGNVFGVAFWQGQVITLWDAGETYESEDCEAS